MKKRNVFIIIGVIILIVGTFLVKGIVKSDKEVEQNNINNVASVSLKEQYEQLRKSSKPSIIIFSYYGGCCEDTKKFLNEYNTKADQLMKDYEKKFTVLFINTGILKGADKDTLMKIEEENGASQLPFILIRDSKGKVIKTMEGSLDDEQTRNILDGVED
jgi:ABC-type lipoprotein release transport system permease subunit